MSSPPPKRIVIPLVILAVVVGLTGIVLARTFLMPVMLAILLTLTFAPIRKWCSRRRIPAAITSAVIVLALISGIASLVLALSGPVQNYMDDAPAIAADVERKLRGISRALETVSEAGEELSQVAGGQRNNDEDEADAIPGPPVAPELNAQESPEAEGGDGEQVVVSTGPSLVTRMAMTAPFIMGQIVFTLVLLFFLLASADAFHRRVVAALPSWSDKRRATEIVAEIESRLSHYFLTVAAINSGLGVAVGVTLWALDMPNPVLFGVMATVLNFIPYLGAIVGIVVTFAIGIVSYDTVGHAAIAAGAYLALTSIEGNFVTPYAVGRNLKLSPVLVFLSVAFWGWAWSFIGMFLAVPLMIVVRVICEAIPRLNHVAMFLSSEDPLAREEREERTDHEKKRDSAVDAAAE